MLWKSTQIHSTAVAEDDRCSPKLVHSLGLLRIEMLYSAQARSETFPNDLQYEFLPRLFVSEDLSRRGSFRDGMQVPYFAIR